MNEDLVERARAGDEHAFSVLVAGSVDRLYAAAYRIMREPDLARDATQQAFFDAWRDLHSLRDAARWEAWTYRLVVHACYERRRAERRYTQAIRQLDGRAAHAQDDVDRIVNRDTLERGFRMLSVEQRSVVVLHHYVGLPLTEVAELLGIPQGTARSRLHVAHRRLRDAIADAHRTIPRETAAR